MRSRELLKRIDRHLDRAEERWTRMDERWDQRWARIEEEIRLTRVEVRLSREQRDRHAEMFAGLRVFTRDMMTRMERVTRDHGNGMQVMSEELRAMGAKHAAAMRDLHEESVAHREALLRVLDRLGPGDSPSAA